MSDREPDPLERAIGALRASTPAGDVRKIREGVLTAFDARYRRPLSWPRLVLAAAALVLVCLALWRVATHDRGATRRLEALTARLEELDARLTALVTDAGSLEAPLRITTADPTAREAISEVLDIAGPDPGYLRLVTAKRYETSDPAAALERYRDLIQDYAASPAASVARARLAELAR